MEEPISECIRDAAGRHMEEPILEHIRDAEGKDTL